MWLSKIQPRNSYAYLKMIRVKEALCGFDCVYLSPQVMFKVSGRVRGHLVRLTKGDFKRFHVDH